MTQYSCIAGGRSAIVSLQARAAGSYRLRVLLYPQSSLHKENPLPDTVGESLIRVVEAGASSAHSWLGSFWPPQGAVAGLPAGLLIQARRLSCITSNMVLFIAYALATTCSDELYREAGPMVSA